MGKHEEQAIREAARVSGATYPGECVQLLKLIIVGLGKIADLLDKEQRP